jgi:hypothetical protein
VYKSPQIFHDKVEKPKNNFILYPNDLFSAINTIFSGSEAIVLLAWLGCKGDGSFAPNISYILKLTGISKAENYYRVKRDLVNSPYVEEDEEGNIHVDTAKIISAWKSGTTKANRKEEKRKERESRRGVTESKKQKASP